MDTEIEDMPLPWFLFNAVVDAESVNAMKYKDLVTFNNDKTKKLWFKGMSKEMDRLANGMPGKVEKGTNTIRFVEKSHVPVGHTVTYTRIVVNI